ncbi:MAG: BrnT family toxin [Acidobacteriota bacterium]
MFDWDKGNLDHLVKHGISRAEAEEVILNNPMDLQFQARNGEERIAQVGETDSGRILVVITTMRGGKIRVVTAFPAAKRLRSLYQTQRKCRDEGGTEEAELQE